MLATLFATALASTGVHKYTLKSVVDRTHANWEKKITTAPLEAPLKTYEATASTWHDQGWGNQKSRVRVALYDRNGKFKIADDLFGIAPHKDAPRGIRAVIDQKLKDASAPGDTLSVETYVGGGGGHVLYLKNFVFIVKQAVDELRSYRIARMDDNTHENWEIKLETSKLKHKLIGYSASVTSYRDQGWGHRKSQVRVVLRDSNGKVKHADDLFGIAPHKDAAGEMLVANDYMIAEKSAPGDYLTVETYVGGGGGHSLHVRDFELIVRQSGDEECPIERNVDYPGQDLNAGGMYGRVKGHLTFDECRLACEMMPACKGFTFVKSEPKGRDNCAVKRAFTEGMRRGNKGCCDSQRICNRRRTELGATSEISEDQMTVVEIEELAAEEALFDDLTEEFSEGDAGDWSWF